MHMADALISPEVGGGMMIATTCVALYSVKKNKLDMDESKIPLMGVMGAFVFAAQMINFTIPGTGASGHLGGGILLAVLLGPYAGFLTMASVLLIQALLFGDGGLIAYGCNVFNLGFYTCFIAYPLIYKHMTRKGITSRKILTASLLSSVIGLQMGSFSVVMETFLSGKTELPFGMFLVLMQPIHLLIGIIEGLIVASVVTYVWKTRPEILEKTSHTSAFYKIPVRKVTVSLFIMALVIGGVGSLFASSNPDGLEWAMEKIAGTTELEVNAPIYESASQIQDNTALLPDYNFKSDIDEVDKHVDGQIENQVFSSSMGTSFSGVVGGILTLVIASFIGFAINIINNKKRKTIVSGGDGI